MAADVMAESETPDPNRKYYAGKDVTVSFDASVCQHAGVCVKGLPTVFDTKARPWINADGAEADEIRAQVERCPSGALRHHPPNLNG
ncbi:MAG: (4Fe-4S)-binding protein [Solirubrobacterales bacterium]